MLYIQAAPRQVISHPVRQDPPIEHTPQQMYNSTDAHAIRNVLPRLNNTFVYDYVSCYIHRLLRGTPYHIQLDKTRATSVCRDIYYNGCMLSRMHMPSENTLCVRRTVRKRYAWFILYYVELTQLYMYRYQGYILTRCTSTFSARGLQIML